MEEHLNKFPIKTQKCVFCKKFYYFENESANICRKCIIMHQILDNDVMFQYVCSKFNIDYTQHDKYEIIAALLNDSFFYVNKYWT